MSGGDRGIFESDVPVSSECTFSCGRQYQAQIKELDSRARAAEATATELQAMLSNFQEIMKVLSAMKKVVLAASFGCACQDGMYHDKDCDIYKALIELQGVQKASLKGEERT